MPFGYYSYFSSLLCFFKTSLNAAEYRVGFFFANLIVVFPRDLALSLLALLCIHCFKYKYKWFLKLRNKNILTEDNHINGANIRNKCCLKKFLFLYMIATYICLYTPENKIYHYPGWFETSFRFCFFK